MGRGEKGNGKMWVREGQGHAGPQIFWPRTVPGQTYNLVDTVYPCDAADFEQRYDDDIKSSRVPVKQRHNVQSCLQYTTTSRQCDVSTPFTARRYASAIYAVVVCPSVCLSQAGIVSKRLHESNCFWYGGFLPSIPHCLIRKFGYLQKLGYFPLGLYPKLRTYNNFATRSRTKHSRNTTDDHAYSQGEPAG